MPDTSSFEMVLPCLSTCQAVQDKGVMEHIQMNGSTMASLLLGSCEITSGMGEPLNLPKSFLGKVQMVIG